MSKSLLVFWGTWMKLRLYWFRQKSDQQGQAFTLDNFSKENWKRFLRISHVELTDILCLQLSNQAHARLCRRKVSLQMELCFPWNTHTLQLDCPLPTNSWNSPPPLCCTGLKTIRWIFSFGNRLCHTQSLEGYFFFFGEKYKESSRIIQLLMLKVGLQD